MSHWTITVDMDGERQETGVRIHEWTVARGDSVCGTGFAVTPDDAWRDAQEAVKEAKMWRAGMSEAQRRVITGARREQTWDRGRQTGWQL